MRAALLVVSLFSLTAVAKPMRKPVSWELEGKKFEGVLVFDDAVKTARPGLVMFPNWLGINEANLKQAEEIAGTRYVLLVADLYGKGNQPKTQEEAGPTSGAVKKDRKLMRARTNEALEALLTAGRSVGMDANRIGAIGFCFGGTAAIELAKSGAKLAGVVSFHGGLDAAMPVDGKILARVLALHGADDPTVPKEALDAFVADLRKSEADWALVQFGNAVHSFTDPHANRPGVSEYNPKVAKRAFQMMEAFFDETFASR